MKAVILAGGYGTRLSEESHSRPKPMVEIGEKPILWHIMKEYSNYGINEFIICAGYKQHVIKEYFADYFLHASDITFDFRNNTNEMIIHSHQVEPWRVTVVDTGLNTQTGGRVRRVKNHIADEPFMLTYGDGVSDVDLSALLAFHKKCGKTVTMTAYHIGQRFGVLDVESDGSVREFREKTRGDGNMINIGYMVCEPEAVDYLHSDEDILEKALLEAAAARGDLAAFKHEGFWKCMDTLREKEQLEALWASGKAPWKTWA